MAMKANSPGGCTSCLCTTGPTTTCSPCNIPQSAVLTLTFYYRDYNGTSPPPILGPVSVNMTYTTAGLGSWVSPYTGFPTNGITIYFQAKLICFGGMSLGTAWYGTSDGSNLNTTVGWTGQPNASPRTCSPLSVTFGPTPANTGSSGQDNSVPMFYSGVITQ